MCNFRSNLKLKIVSLTIAIVSVSPIAVVASTVAFDTFGPGDSFYADGVVYGIDGNAVFQAFQFIPTTSGALHEITVAVGRTGSATTQTQFNLYAGTSNALGALLESSIVANTSAPDATFPFTGAVVSFNSLVQSFLTSGQIYWLGFTEPNARDGASSLWFFNDQGLSGTSISSANPAGLAALPAFRIEVKPIPIPGALALFASSLAGLGFKWRRKIL